MRRLPWATLLVACVLAGGAHAQGTAAAVTRHARQTSVDRFRLTAADTSHPPDFALRFLAGIGGGAVGLLAGAYAGPAIFGTDCGGCDDPGLERAAVGALVGTVTGAAIAAALPKDGSHCGFGGRFGRAWIGSAIGGVIGLLVSGGSPVILASVPVGAAGGGAVGAQVC